MGMFSGRRRRLVYAGVAATASISAMMSPLARADAPSSTLLVDNGSTTSVTLDIDNVTHGTYQDVYVGLDGNCIGPLKGPKNYNVLANSANTTKATVTPGERDDLVCTGAPGSFRIATTPAGTPTDPNDPSTDPACAALGTTTVTFTPNTQPNGIARKLHGASVTVTVVDSNGHCTPIVPCPSCGGNGGNNPAAPAVANSYLNGVGAAPLVAACKSAYHNSKNWRGTLISFIANTWMPKPESVKDDPEWVDPYSWVGYVDTEVNHLCAYNDGSGDAPIPADPRLNPYT